MFLWTLAPISRTITSLAASPFPSPSNGSHLTDNSRRIQSSPAVGPSSAPTRKRVSSSPLLCISCSSTLSLPPSAPLSLLSSSDHPSRPRTDDSPTTSTLSSSKPNPDHIAQSAVFPYILTPCCQTPICEPCLERNPRLKRWQPCLWCGDGVEAIRASRRPKNIMDEDAERDERGEEAKSAELPENFEIGEDSDSEMDLDLDSGGRDRDESLASGSRKSGNDRLSRGPSGVRAIPGTGGRRSKTSSPPPAYTVIPTADPVHLPAFDNAVEPRSFALIAGSEAEPEPVRHAVRRGDTVSSLAKRYAMDPYTLLRLNNIPHSALYANPALLQTRKSVIISLGRSTLRKQAGEEAMYVSSVWRAEDRERHHELAEEQQDFEEESEHRQKQRMVKRFQLVTKQVDPAVARAYLAVQQIDDASASAAGLPESSSEVLFSLDDEADDEGQAGRLSQVESEKSRLRQKELVGEEKKIGPYGVHAGRGGIDGRAIDRYFDDEDWESSHGATLSTGRGSGKEAAKEGLTNRLSNMILKGGASGKDGRAHNGKGLHPTGRSEGFKQGTLVQGAPWI